jgi:polyphosphate kinase
VQEQVMRILATELRDNQDAWELGADTVYRRMVPAPDEKPFRSQQLFMEDSFGLIDLP